MQAPNDTLVTGKQGEVLAVIHTLEHAEPTLVEGQ
jgi:hypothetical protein